MTPRAGRLGFDAKLLSEVSDAVNGALLDFYERALRDRGGGRENTAEFGESEVPSTDSDGAKHHRKLQSGTVTVVQRTSSDLRLNPHLPIVALDGVFAEEPDGAPSFIQLPELASIDVAEALTTLRSRGVRRGVLESQTTGELEFACSDAAERHLARQSSQFGLFGG